MSTMLQHPSQATELKAIDFPLHGSRLIEASAGTGKTYTIAALFVRLVLGHGRLPHNGQGQAHQEQTAYARALLPSDILVMTFTKAATQELSSRIQARLVEVAEAFRQDEGHPIEDAFILELLQAYPTSSARLQAAWQLNQAALCMDEASVFTIDAWCQKVLKEHAIHTGQPFDEELVVNEQSLRLSAVQDFWRKTVYAMDVDLARHFKGMLPNEVADLVSLVESFFKNQKVSLPKNQKVETASFVSQFQALASTHAQTLRLTKRRLSELSVRVSSWIELEWTQRRSQWNGTKLGQQHLQNWILELSAWCGDAQAVKFPDKVKERWSRFSPESFHLARHAKADAIELPDFIFEFFDVGHEFLKTPSLLDQVWPLMVDCIGAEITSLKAQRGQFGFSDLLHRLDLALKAEHGEFLKSQLREQFPIIMIDEFQDTSPIQYGIFDEIYQIESNGPETGIFLIGDPKQSIYSFRGADIKSYLRAKLATQSRHYVLGKNYRSSSDLVNAVNALFLLSEVNRPSGAFSYRSPLSNPLPFLAVQAQGLKETLVGSTGPIAPITTVYHQEVLSTKTVREIFSAHCAEQVVKWLSDEQLVFKSLDGSQSSSRRLVPADIAILVRTGVEAQVIRSALARRGVSSVYLSDKDSVFKTREARDLAHWMRAVLTPLDSSKVKSALALPMFDFSIVELHQINTDENLFDHCSNLMRELERVWRHHGLLAMVRKTLSLFNLPQKWLRHTEGQRKLTNVLQLSEILQAQSHQVHAQRGLLDWLINAITDATSGTEEHILRLESDAELVKIVTIHKSKGLEFNVVMLPFATTFNTNEHVDLVEDDLVSEDADPHLLDDASKENIRLMYVALTRAKHAIWLGFSRLNHNGRGACVTHQSALGVMMTDAQAPSDEQVWLALLTQYLGQNSLCALVECGSEGSMSHLPLIAGEKLIQEPLIFRAHIDLRYRFSSFSSLLRSSRFEADSQSFEMVTAADDEPLVIEGQQEATHRLVATAPLEFSASLTVSNRLQSANPCLGIAGGIDVGNFMHEILRWSLVEGKRFDNAQGFQLRLLQRIELLMPRKLKLQEEQISSSQAIKIEHSLLDEKVLVGMSMMSQLVFKWVCQILYEPLKELGTGLMGLNSRLTEAEFWMSCAQFEAAKIESVVAKYFYPQLKRQAIQSSDWHGMLMGFSDLLFECNGKYYVLDYKTNSLGHDLQDYGLESLERETVLNRYDLQAAIYLLALHRLLKTRLASAYQPDLHLGGAFVWYLRGVNAKGQGLCFLKASAQLMDELELTLQRDSFTDSLPLGGGVA